MARVPKGGFVMNDCEWRSARAWALGAISTALALVIIVVGIAAAVRLSHTDSGRVCAKGHDADNGPSVSTYFVCDEWVPKPGATP